MGKGYDEEGLQFQSLYPPKARLSSPDEDSGCTMGEAETEVAAIARAAATAEIRVLWKIMVFFRVQGWMDMNR